MKMNYNSKIDFNRIAQELLPRASGVILSLKLSGKLAGNEFIAFNPVRNDKSLGSFKINLKTGKWADFATDDKGSDLVSLYAYLRKTSQFNAAVELCNKYGINPYVYGGAK